MLLVYYFWSYFYLSLITKPSSHVTTLIYFFFLKEQSLLSRKFSLSIQKEILHYYKNFSKKSVPSHKIRIRPTISYLKFRGTSLDTESLNERRELAGSCVKWVKTHSDKAVLFLCIFIFWLQYIRCLCLAVNQWCVCVSGPTDRTHTPLAQNYAAKHRPSTR